MKQQTIDKAGSVTSRVYDGGPVGVSRASRFPATGDVIVARALSESMTYGQLELASGRLAKINSGDVILGALGRRRALKGFVGEVPASIKAGDRLHLLNMGGVIGQCTGHHSSLTDAIELEVIGCAINDDLELMNIADNAFATSATAPINAPVVMVGGSCMNSGKTVAAIEIIKQANRSGLRVAAGKLTGIACLRDTLNMKDHGAFVTASFLDQGLPSTVDQEDLPAVAHSILSHLDSFSPDLIVAELGDGVIGGYGVEAILSDRNIREAISCFVFCANDYLGVVGGKEFLEGLGITIDAVAGSVTDSRMGEEFIRDRFGMRAGNARRDGASLFRLIKHSIEREVVFA